MNEEKRAERNGYVSAGKIRGLRVHHLGIAVAEIEESIRGFESLGWVRTGDIIEDEARRVRLAFLCREGSDEKIELVAPAGENSPVSGMLRLMKNNATPYHICYAVNNIEEAVRDLVDSGFLPLSDLAPAVAFEGRRVAFLMNKTAGLVELLEEAD